MEIRDELILSTIDKEKERQLNGIELIASENFVSPQVQEAQGSVLTNKYAEGYPGKRYYGGCEYVDIVEQAAIDRAKDLFGADYVNVQPHSGSSANLAVYRALLEEGDRVLGLDLNEGGHLTHGSPVNFSGRSYEMYAYGTDPETNYLDYDAIERQAKEVRPKMIIAGATAYSRHIDFERIGEIARSVDAYYMVDMAHIAGLVATGAHQNPVPYADVVTTTTHKTLRGPRGGMILAKEEFATAIRKEIFPGLQGGPLMHVIAAKAIALYEASQPQFKAYIDQVIKNAQAMAQVFQRHGVDVVSGGTDNHMFLVDLTHLGITGKDAQEKLDQAGITTNKNTIPGETLSPTVTSGLRIGTAAVTTRGLKEKDVEAVAELMIEVLQADESEVPALREKARDLVKDYPLFQWFD